METPNRSLRNLHLKNVEQQSTPIKIPSSPFMKSLGFGTGVHVLRLERSPRAGLLRSPWAVKRISRNAIINRTETGAKLFNSRIQEEADILRRLSHPNIVGFRGIQTGADGVESLVLECCKTSLGALLEERKDEDLGPLPAKETLKMILDVSHALDYLHTEARLLHADLKSFNVLIKGDFDICKLCDFGVSLPLDQNGLVNFKTNPNLRYVGTNIWSAPEIIDEADEIDCKADIFSFGLIIYETLALVPPHCLSITAENDLDCISLDDTVKSENQENSINSINSSHEIFNQWDQACGTRPPLPQAFEMKEEYDRVIELFYCCTNENAEDRPLAKTIWQSLEKK